MAFKYPRHNSLVSMDRVSERQAPQQGACCPLSVIRGFSFSLGFVWLVVFVGWWLVVNEKGEILGKIFNQSPFGISVDRKHY